MVRTLPHQVDTVIVGNGPSALILSYILHGNIPEYDPDSPHPDSILHEKLKSTRELLLLDVDHLTEHFNASRFSYSTQALPVNVLLDTLNRPFGETDEAEKKTCIRWQHDPQRRVSHIVVGDTPRAGGHWSNNPVGASLDIGALSYAGMLSLPGYTFEDYFVEKYGKPLAFYSRPPRREVAEYLAIYPEKVGIADTVFSNIHLAGIQRCENGFYIGSHNITCKHLVLASGTFTNLIYPRPLLQPLLKLEEVHNDQNPVLVIGSGFSAADVIISTPPNQKIIHIFKWSPTKAPSPLRACHNQAYPDYAGVYRKMKLAAISYNRNREKRSVAARRGSSQFELSRDWDECYEGLPNTEVVDVELHDSSATVILRHGDDPTFRRTISKLAYMVGRRGSFDYLNPAIVREISPERPLNQYISGQTLREKAIDDLEIADNIFIIGNLTGDSLIRFAYGGCAYAAGKIMKDGVGDFQRVPRSIQTPTRSTPRTGTPVMCAMNGLDGHDIKDQFLPVGNLEEG